MKDDWLKQAFYEAFDAHLALARQPIVSVKDNPEPHARYEILLRLKTPQGLVSAFPIIRECERLGSIALLDQWVLEKTFALLSETSEGSYNVNISPDSLNNTSRKNLISFIWEFVRFDSVDPRRLGIELVERYEHALSGRSDLNSLILYLKQQGCRIALDDFGEGRHSFRDLISTIQPTSLKIDGSLIQDIAVNPQTRQLVWHLVQVAQIYGIETIAEAVESSAIYDAAIDLGFDFLQGFYVGKPEAIE